MNEFMNKAHEMALKNSENNFQDGGPFGAVIVDKDNNIIAATSNSVLKDNDPTAHAEINAIRAASKKLNTFDLSGCVLYTSCYPCPMCASAIIWANIKTVYYGNTKEDADAIGFRDDKIYDYFKNNDDTLRLIPMNRDITIEAFNKYKNNNSRKEY